MPLSTAHLLQAAIDIERFNSACAITRSGVNVPELLRAAAEEIEGLRRERDEVEGKREGEKGESGIQNPT